MILKLDSHGRGSYFFDCDDCFWSYTNGEEPDTQYVRYFDPNKAISKVDKIATATKGTRVYNITTNFNMYLLDASGKTVDKLV